MSVIIIGEVGVNHNGDLTTGKKLIDIAASSGVDIVKFQTFRADRLATRNAKRADYQINALGGHLSQYEMLKELELSWDAHTQYKAFCESRGVEFLSTAFDEESLSDLVKLGQRRLKIPSGEINNIPYLRNVGQYSFPILLSTGMATLHEIETALVTIENAGTSRKNITVLHCTTEYPAKVDEVNLRAMQTIQDTFEIDVGYSDHTLGIEVPIAAVAMGAKVIEKHFTLDCELPGPDHQASLDPAQLGEMVSAIRKIEKALGNGEKKPTASELKNRDVVRKSIVASEPIKKGQILSEKNVCVKRPGTGVSPTQWDRVIGSIAVRDFKEDELIAL
jgi:N,N'-diacetyllegionaminate synthase